MRCLFRLSCLAAVLFGSMTIASAQYVVSAKAGLVNYVDHRVTVKHEDGNTEKARVGLQLENGDVIDSQGRVEILLNPGAVLRLERGSLLKVVETKFTNMRFDLDAGAALVEATKDMGSKHGIGLEIKTREASLSIEKYGVYEIVASPTGSTVVMVHKGNGEVRPLTGSAVNLKGGHQLTITGSTVAEAKTGKNSSEFEQWGQERAETLAALNNRIDIRQTMVGQRPDTASGLWYFSQFWGTYLYMPYSNFYTSPYGYWYDAFYDPYYWGNRNHNHGYGNGGNGGTVGGGGTGTGTRPTKTTVASNPKDSPTVGPVHNPPSGNRPSPTSAGRDHNAGNRVASPGPTHASSVSRGESSRSGNVGGGSYSGGGSYNGGGGYSTGGGTSGVSAPSAPSAPSSSSSSKGGSSSSSSGSVGRSRGN